ncbi:hypothetical protein C0Q70_03595 [Pomacea canaliculata]|uniref:Uncharacterized protein n=1 Tax=Pomacea canaliculata TaxID=400727 RepID=A0A2T7PT93_POMCA|nr:hypothetical protein C0Q70_03595 [Pomacea canaliculata]
MVLRVSHDSVLQRLYVQSRLFARLQTGSGEHNRYGDNSTDPKTVSNVGFCPPSLPYCTIEEIVVDSKFLLPADFTSLYVYPLLYYTTDSEQLSILHSHASTTTTTAATTTQNRGCLPMQKEYVKLFYRDCSDGERFSVAINGSRLDDPQPDNITHCAFILQFMGQVCITLCSGHFCNGPNNAGTTLGTHWSPTCLLLLSSRKPSEMMDKRSSNRKRKPDW